MDNPSPQDIQLNIEHMKEDMATFGLMQDRDSRVLYGDADIRLPGLLDRMEIVEDAIKAINGMPAKVDDIDTKFGVFVEADKKRTWIISGIGIGLGIQLAQTTGLWAVIVKVFS